MGLHFYHFWGKLGPFLFHEGYIDELERSPIQKVWMATLYACFGQFGEKNGAIFGGFDAFNTKDEEFFDFRSLVLVNNQFEYASHECNRFFGSFGHYVGASMFFFSLSSGLVSFLEPLFTSCILLGSSIFF